MTPSFTELDITTCCDKNDFKWWKRAYKLYSE